MLHRQSLRPETMWFIALNGMDLPQPCLRRNREFESRDHCRFLPPECWRFPQAERWRFCLAARTLERWRACHLAADLRGKCWKMLAAQTGGQMENRLP